MADPLEARMFELMEGEIADRERQRAELDRQREFFHNQQRGSAFPQYGGYPQYGGGYGGGGYRGGGGGYVTPAQLAREAHRRQMSDEQWARRKEYERQLDEQEKQAQAQELEKKMADLQDPNSQLHKDLSPSERINTYNRLRAQALDISPGASKVYVELVPNGKVYPDWHEKAGENLPPDRLIIHENGEREMKYAEDEMLKRSEAKIRLEESIAKTQEGKLPPRFDPDEPGFDKVAREAAIKDQETFIEKEAVKAGEEAKAYAESVAQDDEDEIKGGLENDYEEENEAYKESKANLKAWEANLPTISIGETEKNEELRADPSRNFVEHNGRWYETSPKPTVGDRPRKALPSAYRQDAKGKGSAAYREAYERRKRELEARKLEDAKETMRKYKGSASLGMPDVGNIASSGPSMAVNPDTGHQLTLEGDSWA